MKTYQSTHARVFAANCKQVKLGRSNVTIKRSASTIASRKAAKAICALYPYKV